MGSDTPRREKYYNRYNCFNCSACNNRNYYSCDNCSASCCINCMSSHRDLFNLNDDFNDKLQYAIKDLCEECKDIKRSLSNSYDIYIYYYSELEYLYQCKDFLNSMKKKKTEFENKLNNSEISTIKINFTNSLNDLRRQHENNLNRLRNDFNEKKQKCSFTKDNSLERKTEEKNNLEKDKAKIDEDKEKIIKNYENEEKSKAESEFNKNKNKINEKYVYNEEKLEYTENELKLRQKYIEEIQKIKPYTNDPRFNCIIFSSGLYKYLN